MALAIYLILWGAPGVLVYGFMLAWFQRSTSPIRAAEQFVHDRTFARLMAFSGPVGLIITGVGGYWRKGLMFRRIDR